MTADGQDIVWDAFISHAHEDKAQFVAALARELSARDLKIWYDDDILEVGDSVRMAIDHGLAKSDFGVVVISPDFMRKDWTNRELDGILAREKGIKRLLPVWHHVEHDGVLKYSPTVAGRFAVRSAIGVVGVADALCRAMKRGAIGSDAGIGSDPESGPVFRSQVNMLANSRVYGWVVVGTTIETSARFSDDEIETYTSWLNSLEARAMPRQVNGGFIWMNVLDESGGTALWSAEVRPGPVVSLLTELDVRDVSPQAGSALSFEHLVGWWGTVVGALPALAGNLGIDRLRLGFGLHPYGPNTTRVTQFDFLAAPEPKRRAEAHQIPPWHAETPLFDPFTVPTDLLTEPVRDLLDSLSYGRVEATTAWVADALVHGSLRNRYRGPAGLSDGRACKVCGSDLRARELVDPPEDPNTPSADLECRNQDCRALHDARGGFLRRHPAIELRHSKSSEPI